MIAKLQSAIPASPPCTCLPVPKGLYVFTANCHHGIGRRISSRKDHNRYTVKKVGIRGREVVDPVIIEYETTSLRIGTENLQAGMLSFRLQQLDGSAGKRI